MGTSVQTLPDTTTTNKPARSRAVCPACQHPKPVRVNGVMAAHRNYTGTWCSGRGLTPIPRPVPVPDYSAAGLHDGKTLDRWDFLTLPLVTLLHITRTEVREVAEPEFAGSIRPVTAAGPWRWIVRMPIGGSVLTHDLGVRALLAAVHGVDTTDWPLDVVVGGAQ